jgi:hypothetical protein
MPSLPIDRLEHNLKTTTDMPIEMIDIRLDEDEDMLVAGGDIGYSESTAQHQRQLILNGKGDFKENPDMCVGAMRYLDDEGAGELARAISVELLRDGMEVVSVVQEGGQLKTHAFYRQIPNRR